MKHAIPERLSRLRFWPNRTPETSLTGEGADAFAAVAPYRDGAIYLGHYAGSSEWEQHPEDEIVMVLAGTTTVVVLQAGIETRVAMQEGDLLVVDKGTWHRFENADALKVFTVTPQPTQHALTRPGN